MTSITANGFQTIEFHELCEVNGGSGAWNTLKDLFAALPAPVKPAILIPAAAIVLYEGGKKIGSYVAETVYWSTH
ncbi:hypothetical protein LY28_02847 [Ruminiclostridium sufflavum DSM 19573]|uniref:Uncharacterized protein n=1 Tax=Ruminiclostridium sufflavum DSM 19573 TaxID=1121337 RepID=A0A318XJJ3_9FIRM|nr:hypothetical protein [Ruminiclostridium sufflavum]PYG86628.1 hypothetical protein LY28_02847 [Ruminiclostridium sufflavum DSM 19573]